MILKELRISRHISQEQLAQMSGLNVRTIQRIESGSNASLESLKCIAAVLEVDISTLNQEKFMIDKSSDNWKNQSVWIKWWFFFNYCSFRPSRKATTRGIALAHTSGFLFCCLGIINEGALIGGLFMLLTAYFLTFLAWQGDNYGIWFDAESDGAQ
jgi:transcriptional regulator with XRE-family HTH domain